MPQYDIILTTGTIQNVESSGITTNFKPIYLKPKPTTTTTSTTLNYIELLSFDVDTTNATEFPWLEFDFIIPIGTVKMDFGNGLYTIIKELSGSYDWFGYQYTETPSEWYDIPFPSPAGVYNVTISYLKNNYNFNVQEAKDEIWLAYFYDLELTGNFDISSFQELNLLDIQHSSINSLTLPSSWKSDWGFDSFMLHTVSNLNSVDFSNTTFNITTYEPGTITIQYCPDIEIINVDPIGADLNLRGFTIDNNNSLTTVNITKNMNVDEFTWFNIRDNINLNSLNVTGGTCAIRFFDISNTNISYKNWGVIFPNLTNISGSSSYNRAKWVFNDNNYTSDIVNHILVDLDNISTSGYNNRYIAIGGTNSPPDNTSGGYDGLAAKVSLESKGFSVYITNPPTTTTTTTI